MLIGIDALASLMSTTPALGLAMQMTKATFQSKNLLPGWQQRTLNRYPDTPTIA
ncbi:UNVERIFIED_ORG: hypothetical protein J2Y78_004142 [Buttiauxella agrestis ATCC 33320]